MSTFLNSSILFGAYSVPFTAWVVNIANSTGAGTISANWAAVDSTREGNYYVVGSTNASGNADAFLLQFSSTGAVNWQRLLVSGNGEGDPARVITDSSNFVYLTFGSPVTLYGAQIIAKYNSSGTLQWQRALNKGTDFSTPGGMNIDVSGNPVVVGQIGTSGYVVKYNNAGTVQWQNVHTLTNGSKLSQCVADSTNSIISVGFSNLTPSGLIIKTNSAGTVQWQRNLTNVSGVQINDVTVDSSDNIYTISQINYGNRMNIAKLNSTGTLQWQREFNFVSSFSSPGAISTDSSGNVFVIMDDGVTNSGKILFAKYNTNGALQFQRSLRITNIHIRYAGGCQVKDNTVVTSCALKSGGTESGSVLKFFVDGTITGTFGSYVYAASAYTEATGTCTGGTPTMSTAAGALTSSGSFFTSSTTSFTLTKTNLFGY